MLLLETEPGMVAVADFGADFGHQSRPKSARSQPKVQLGADLGAESPTWGRLWPIWGPKVRLLRPKVGRN